MEKLFIMLLLLLQFIQIEAQKKKVEIFDIASNSVIKGIVLDDPGDSLYISTENSEIIVLAKSDLQGLEFGTSKEIRKLQMKLIRNESGLKHFDFQWLYNTRNDERLKDKAIKLLLKTGVVSIGAGSLGALLSLSIRIGAMAGNIPNLALISGAIFTGFSCSFLTGIILIGIGGMWHIVESTIEIIFKVKNRYYHTGGKICYLNKI